MTATTPSMEAHEPFSAYEYEPYEPYEPKADAMDTMDTMDTTGGPNRSWTLSISHIPFVLFSVPERAKARYSTKSLLPSDVDVAFPLSPITPPPPLPLLRQSDQTQPPNTLPLPTRAASNPEPRLLGPDPSPPVLPARPSLPQPPPMATPAVPRQLAPVGRSLTHTGPVSSSAGPRVRPLPQRPPPVLPIDDQSPWSEPDGKIGRSNSTPLYGYHSEVDPNTLRRNRHIRRAQKVALGGPRPLPPLPGASSSMSIILTESNHPTSKRVSSPTQPAPPRILTSLHRSKSDPISPSPHPKPNLSLLIPKSQTENRDRHLPQQEPRPTATSSREHESLGSQDTKLQPHSLHYFPTIDYASVNTPSASRRPPPSAHPDNSTLLDWHLLEEALGIDGDGAVVQTESPAMVSFLPSPDAPPVPAIPDRFLVDRE